MAQELANAPVSSSKHDAPVIPRGLSPHALCRWAENTDQSDFLTLNRIKVGAFKRTTIRVFISVRFQTLMKDSYHRDIQIEGILEISNFFNRQACCFGDCFDIYPKRYHIFSNLQLSFCSTFCSTFC